MKKKALSLLSGGLDSILATKLMLEQGVEVQAINFSSVFCSCTGKDEVNVAKTAAQNLGVPLKIIDFSEEFLEIIKNPRHGYGANVNPCIDCRIFMLNKAKEYMDECKASFIVTGEVMGERPMSQRKDTLLMIEKKSGLKGLILRPLSAKLLEPTAPETQGVIDRARLLDISGRSRKPQIALAKEFGIEDYPNPAGGCLLTDPGFAKRVKDLIKHDSMSVDDMRLLTVGRHFRISKNAKLVVGRDVAENQILQSLAKTGDIFFKLKDRQGPLSILRGNADNDSIEIAASIASYHTKFRNEDFLEVNYWSEDLSNDRTVISTKPAAGETVESFRI